MRTTMSAIASIFVNYREEREAIALPSRHVHRNSAIAWRDSSVGWLRGPRGFVLEFPFLCLHSRLSAGARARGRGRDATPEDPGHSPNTPTRVGRERQQLLMADTKHDKRAPMDV